MWPPTHSIATMPISDRAFSSVGIAATISPLAVGPEVLARDAAVMGGLTLLLFLFGYGFRGPGRINRVEGTFLLCCFVGYTGYLIRTVFSG